MKLSVTRFAKVVVLLVLVSTAAEAGPWPVQGAVDYTPIVPQLRGPGVNTPAGSGRRLGVRHVEGETVATTVYRVNVVDNDGSGIGADSNTLTALSDGTWRGTLRGAISRHNSKGGPSTIVFEKSGTITLSDHINVYASNLTIAGQTAPAPGVQLRGYGLGIYSNDVLIQHLTVRRGFPFASVGSNDVIAIGEPPYSAERVVLDHLALGYGFDENLSAIVWNDITIANTILHDNIAGNETGTREGSKHALIDQQGPHQNLLFFGNLFHTTQARQPLTRAVNTAVLNNYLYNPAVDPTEPGDNQPYGIIMEYFSGSPRATIAGNVIRRGPDTPSGVFRQITFFSTVSGTQVYVARNYGYDRTAGGALVLPTEKAQYSRLVNFNGGSSAQVQGINDGGLIPYMPAGLVWMGAGDPNEVTRVLPTVTAYAGPRPAERLARKPGLYDTVTALVVDEARSNGASPDKPGTTSRGVIDSSKIVWPTYSVNSQPLVLPDRAGEIGPNGYTRLEEWLHQLASGVEGTAAPVPQPPQVTVQ